MNPRLKRSIVIIEAPDGDLVLMRTAADDIRISRPDDSERALLACLDGTHRLAELEQRFGLAETTATIAALNSAGLLEDAAEEELLLPDVRERFDRQLRYFSDVTTPDGPTPVSCQKTLAEKTVAVFGAGGLGGPVAIALATTGIGELRIIDGDRVELSNLNRQIQYTEAQLGLLKVECLAAHIRAFNSRIEVVPIAERVESEERLADFIDGADLLVEAADWPAHVVEHWSNSACFAAGVPYIAMSHFPPIVRIGPLYVPGRTGCFACQEAAWRRRYPLFDLAVDQQRGHPSPAPTLGPACLTTAGLVAGEALHLLTGVAEPATLGTGWALDLRTMEVETYQVTPQPGCRVCAGEAIGAAA